ncbi:hypothetical protein PROFUN_15030 [Planoprotostelium fungivorum]|uniref:CHCH domain-containing protein n=1 Tax=Planoprotostelium fungivorum TaxID=1890364 RepID=A0A2P6MXZ4_9EUKA|nr:hypothetical protein PROFUN_15030 [Planoprotostelium fungivorum]
MPHEPKGAFEELHSLVDQFGCAKYYYSVEECLNANNRDFRKCQTEMREFQKCYMENKKKAANEQKKNRSTLL